MADMPSTKTCITHA